VPKLGAADALVLCGDQAVLSLFDSENYPGKSKLDTTNTQVSHFFQRQRGVDAYGMCC
jgi:hypothetical protein